MKTLLLVHQKSNWGSLPERLTRLEMSLSAKLLPVYGKGIEIEYKVVKDVPGASDVENGNIKNSWFKKMGRKYPGYKSYGYLFSPDVGKIIGVQSNINGIYYADSDNVFEFWIKTTEKKREKLNRKNRKDKEREYQFELIMEHELAGHGIAHSLGLPYEGDAFKEGTDNTHHFFYQNDREGNYEYLAKHYQTRVTLLQNVLDKLRLLFKKTGVKDISKDNKFYFVDKKYIDRVTQPYLAYNPIYKSNYHLGTDYATPSGTPLIAPVDGEITDVRNGYHGGLTCVYTFNHEGKQYSFRFMHLLSSEKEGEYKAGDLIGYTGNSGAMTTGQHLHVDCWHGDTIYIEKIKDVETIKKYTVDPQKIIKSMVE